VKLVVTRAIFEVSQG